MKDFIFNIKNIGMIVCLLPGSVLAQNWTGNVNTDWNNSANWTGWPLGGDDIVIDPANYTGAAASPVIGSNSVFTPGGILVQNGAQLTVNANLSANDRIEILGTGTNVTINGGTLHAAGGGSTGRFIVGELASINMNGGTLTANQRVIVELGATFILNNGTINSTELAIGDGDVAGSSLFEMHNGLVSIDGLGFENEAGLFYPTFNMSGGTLDVNGDISWLGEAPGAGTPKFIMTGGSATVQGNLINDPASTVDLYIHLSGTAGFVFGGTIIDQVHTTDSIIQSGTSVLMLNNTHSWNNAGVFYATGGSTVLNGTTNLNGAGTYVFNHATIQPGKTLSQVTPSVIHIKGDLVNNGNFNTGTHTVVFSGSAAQSIGGSSITSFNGFTLNNASPAGLTLNTATTVTGNLQLTNGKLNTSATTLLTLTDNASSSQGSDTSFINGPMKKTGDDAFVFPVGKDTLWRRLEISTPPSTTSSFTAEYFNHAYSSTTPVSSPLTAVTSVEYWTLDRSNPADDVQLTLYWENATSSAITHCSELSLAYWNGTSWENILSNATGTCSGTGNGSIQSVSPVGNATAYTFGFYSGVTVQDLSICSGETVTVGSNTYNVSGTYIDVLTSTAMTDSVVITNLEVAQPVTATVSGLTLTADVTGADAYQWLDCNNAYAVIAGETSQVFTVTANGSYAVAMVQGGCIDTSTCYTISTLALEENGMSNSVKLYPNPNDGQFTLNIPATGLMTLMMVDVHGRQVFKLQEPVQAGQNKQLNVQGLAKGLYYVQVNIGTMNTVEKLVIE